MTNRAFDAILAERLAKTRTVLASKGDQYDAPGDRLRNFKDAAALTGESPAQVCIGFMAKHLVGLFDVVNRQARGDHSRDHLLDERVTDAVNYLVLLEALVADGATELPNLGVEPGVTCGE